MSGIVGVIVPNNPAAATGLVQQMIHVLEHRGPDGSGFARTGSAAIGMCYLRVRFDKNGVLPFLLNDLDAAYDGELYMHEKGELDSSIIGKEEVAVLARHTWRETDGMYALALLDRKGNVRLMRDLAGIKPLFLRDEARFVSFASELPALLAVASSLSIDQEAFHEILTFGRTLDRRTLYRGIRELAPGEEIMFASDGNVVYRSVSPSFLSTNGSVTDSRLRESIREAIARTLTSDRQLGLALSGGLDSSILAHELRSLGVRNLRTISLVLPDNQDGLTKLAELGLGNDSVSATWKHSTLSFDESSYFAALIDAAPCYGEPFRMSSLPLYYALGAEAQRQGITVLFLGEGADELFGGYESYRSFSGNESDPLASLLDFYLGGSNHYYLTRLLGSKVVASLRHRLEETLKPLITGRTPKQALLAAERLLSLEPLLRRTDHALMMSGIEGRTPFLHGRIPELAMALPELELWSPRETKCALRRSYADMLPPSIISTPKRNFRAPAHSWRAEGVAALDDFVRHGKAFLAMLGLQEDGVAAVRAGCAEGDPAAIPLATGLLSISACLSKLAQEGRLASSDLNQAASEVEFIFNGIRNVRMHGESTRA